MDKTASKYSEFLGGRYGHAIINDTNLRKGISAELQTLDLHEFTSANTTTFKTPLTRCHRVCNAAQFWGNVEYLICQSIQLHSD